MRGDCFDDERRVGTGGARDELGGPELAFQPAHGSVSGRILAGKKVALVEATGFFDEDEWTDDDYEECWRRMKRGSSGRVMWS